MGIGRQVFLREDAEVRGAGDPVVEDQAAGDQVVEDPGAGRDQAAEVRDSAARLESDLVFDLG